MGVIRVLPPGLVNRIAAGECVERPASVLKELVENALDAGARRVDVQIEEGGRDLIQVSDDGVGMDAEDLRLSITPHATSKLRDDDDLFNIQTLGFRGEALPSIGAVARLRITSRRAESDVGHVISVEAGAVAGPSPCAAPEGTTVAVRDLFYCVPARRKFLKTNATETGHITEQLARIALAQPGAAFTLTQSRRVLHRLPAANDRLRRIADFFGGEVCDGLLHVTRRTDGFELDGYVAPPARCRKSTKWEYIFVNGRFIRDRFVSHAVKEAYRSLIQPGEFPVAFLFISIAPDRIDVNVHPTKIEVRWRDSNFVHSQVLAAIREKFLGTNLDRGFRAASMQAAPAPGATAAADAEHRERVRSAMVEFFTGGQAAARAREPASAVAYHPAAVTAEPTLVPRHAVTAEIRRANAMPECDTSRIAEPDRIETATSVRAVPVAILPPRPLAALQVHNTYLVVESPDGVLLIDQHALHERILYEELKSRLASRPLEAQRLLLPESVSVPPDRLEALETHAETLARLGVELTPTGPQSVTLHAFPSLLERADRTQFIRDLLDLLAQPGVRPEPDTLLHKLLDMLACKAAVKAGDPLTADEIAALLSLRELAERSSHCPHGRPTTLHLTLRDLERQFKRR
jgi:DNA mismatch repair protein MutL